MEIIKTLLLSLAAFGLASVPFSILVGKWILHEDIRHFGDGNPGAANVFKAGGQKSGVLAVLLDVAKGIPFVLLAYFVFDLPAPSLVAIGIAAVLGHAWSPFLGWRGGKAIAVTFGVLLAYPRHEILLAFIIFMVFGFLFIDSDSWVPVFGAAATAIYSGVTHGGWSTLLMALILAILTIKQLDSIHHLPGLKGRLVRWVQALVKVTLSIL
ncbi:MAG TPA: glycerol-3-phosphate acyltransferase [Dehalococcoidales bacterium]|nr:glycerol-3-phosphate acyltransferase [Dehalococcoidales bacterium]